MVQRTAEAGHKEAMHSLGICYEDGEGTAVNKGETIKWYTLAAEAGYTVAQVAFDQLLRAKPAASATCHGHHRLGLGRRPSPTPTALLCVSLVCK